MRLDRLLFPFSFVVGAMVIALPAASQTLKPQPLLISLQCADGDCPLLTGDPHTAGMRSGYVRLVSLFAVLFFAHFFHPGDGIAIELLGNGDVRH